MRHLNERLEKFSEMSIFPLWFTFSNFIFVRHFFSLGVSIFGWERNFILWMNEINKSFFIFFFFSFWVVTHLTLNALTTAVIPNAQKNKLFEIQWGNCCNQINVISILLKLSLARGHTMRHRWWTHFALSHVVFFSLHFAISFAFFSIVSIVFCHFVCLRLCQVFHLSKQSCSLCCIDIIYGVVQNEKFITVPVIVARLHHLHAVVDNISLCCHHRISQKASKISLKNFVDCCHSKCRTQNVWASKWNRFHSDWKWENIEKWERTFFLWLDFFLCVLSATTFVKPV